jgi:N-acyl-L-homoserine lactone synthetase
MVYAISKDNRAWFPRELDTMHRDRKRVFVDRLKWQVPVVDGIYEKDQFDNDDAVYIVAADPITGQHHGSLRLIPSTRPHMLRDVFACLCADGVPIGPDIWEMTRICLSPSLPRELARQSLGLVWLGAVEFGVDNGIAVMTGLTHAPMFANILAAGIEIEPLGPVQDFEGVQYAALQTRIDAQVLEREQARLGERGRVLSCWPLSSAAA